MTDARPAPADGRGDALFHAAAFAVYGALTLLYLGLRPSLLTTRIVPDPGDPLFNLYVLEWVTHQLELGFPALWDPNIFHPAPRALTLSDHLLGPAMVFALARRLLGPAGAYNLLALGSFAATGATTCFVLRRSGHRRASAFLGGALVAFSSFRWDQTSHLQVLLMPWIPPTLWFFDRFLATRRVRQGLLFLLFYALHVTGGSYLALMAHVPLAVLLANRVAVERRRLLDRRFLTAAAAIALAAGALAASVFLPYLDLPPGVEGRRTEQAFRDHGATVASLFTPSEWSRLYGPWGRALQRKEGALFPGFLALGLAAWGAWTTTRRQPPPRPLPAARRWALRALLLAAAAAVVIGDAYTWAYPEPLRLPGVQIDGHRRLGALFLAILGLWLVLHRLWRGVWPWRTHLDPWRRGLLLAGGASAVLMFPLVFTPIAALVPGLSHMRAPTRFMAFVLVALASLAATGCDDLLRRSRRPRALAAALILAALVELAPRPLATADLAQVVPKSTLPAVYGWLAGAAEVRVIAHLPMDDSATLWAMYGSTLHWKPLINGYSGHRPPEYEAVVRLCRYPDRPIDPACLDRLRSLGATHLVVDGRPLGPGQRRRLLAGSRVAVAWTEEARARLAPVWSSRRHVVLRLDGAGREPVSP